jgi:hypothetical protein
MTIVMVRSLCLGLAAFAIAGIATQAGEAQGTSRRRGGPRDWSHGRLVATRFGPDQDAAIMRNWRTAMKHRQLDQAKRRRAQQRVLDWVRRFHKRPGHSPDPDASGATLDWSLRTGGIGSVVGYPAKSSFDIDAADCGDVIYFTVDHTGTASRVNVIGITNPYRGCPGNPANMTPTVKFGLGLPYGVPTSSVPSLDGEVLYVIESRPSNQGGAILHAIRVDNIVSSPGTYNYSSTNWSNARTLAAPTANATSEQLFQIAFAGVTNTTSSPYLDYDSNQMFFGDSQGRIHRIANVNTRSAARDTANFPVQCGSQPLSSPVFVEGQIIVSGASGRLFRIDTTRPPPYTCVAGHQGGTGTSVGGAHSPVTVDVSNRKIIVTTHVDDDFGVRGMAVYDLMFTSGAPPTSTAYLGPGSTTLAPTAVAMDDDFWSTNNGGIYAVGAPQLGLGTYLIRIPYNGTLGTPSGFATLARSNGALAASVATSPVTEFLTASKAANPDFLFVAGVSGNYRFINRISSRFNGTTTAPVAMSGSFAPAGGVVSGLIVDTRTTAITGPTATANVYFGTVSPNASTQSTIVQLAQQF